MKVSLRMLTFEQYHPVVCPMVIIRDHSTINVSFYLKITNQD